MRLVAWALGLDRLAAGYGPEPWLSTEVKKKGRAVVGFILL